MRRPGPRQILLALLLCGSMAYLAYSVRGARRPATAQKPKTGAAAEKGRKVEPMLLTAAPGDAAFARYEEVVKRSIFQPPAPPSPPAGAGGNVLPVPPIPPASQTSAPPAPTPLDFTGWSYVGYVGIDGRMMGILQNESNQSVKYLGIGEEFLGGKVEQVTSEEITLTSPAGPVKLTVPRDFATTPLDRSASGQPGRPRPGGQAGPPGPGPQEQ